MSGKPPGIGGGGGGAEGALIAPGIGGGGGGAGGAFDPGIGGGAGAAGGEPTCCAGEAGEIGDLGLSSMADIGRGGPIVPKRIEARCLALPLSGRSSSSASFSELSDESTTDHSSSS